LPCDARRAFVPQFLARLKALLDGAQNYFRHVAFRFFVKKPVSRSVSAAKRIDHDY
jgi:hypothetical protein